MKSQPQRADEPDLVKEAMDAEQLTRDIYKAMQVPYLSERHDAIKELIMAIRVSVQHADLMWCLGKLRGLGYPATRLEEQYGVSERTRAATKD
jgi:hypothetical protein